MPYSNPTTWKPAPISGRIDYDTPNGIPPGYHLGSLPVQYTRIFVIEPCTCKPGTSWFYCGCGSSANPIACYEIPTWEGGGEACAEPLRHVESLHPGKHFVDLGPG